jgi:uncharacterized protein (DUF2141 family)
MPSNKQRLIGALASIGITVGGAWIASATHSKLEDKALTSFSEGLSIIFDNIRNDTGNIVVMVFADRDAFKAYDITKAASYKEVPAQKGKVKVQFPDLTSGPYAVAAFHDEDKNQDLTMDGEWPTEGYATSGAVDAYDMPTFRKASLSKAHVSISMYYAN